MRINKNKSSYGTGNEYYTTTDIEHPIVPEPDNSSRLKRAREDGRKRPFNNKYSKFYAR